MPSHACITTRVPIPPHLPPESVLAALHAYEPLIKANPYVVSFERRPVDVGELVADPFFRTDGFHLLAYVVHDRVPVIPGVVSKAVVIPCTFQGFAAGARCRADAVGGVTVRSSYGVHRTGEVPLGPGEKEPEAAEAHDWELVEVAEIECGVLVKPFVTRSFGAAHREILQRVVDEVVKGYAGGLAAGQRWG